MIPLASRAALAAGLAAATLLAACQSYSASGIAPGTSRAQVEAGMGRPTAVYPLDQGRQRVEYARGPFGKHTYMLDFDASGRLERSEQVLTEQRFAGIAMGQSRDEVLRALGQPSNVRRLGWQRRDLWSYRYDSLFCTWYQVSFDATDRVVDTGYGPDPACDVDDRPF